ncbi:MAG: hypothetical protein LAO04_20375 [Acidobacteriia bacterium]|nr:hypothetical protein [Terriglobia bacterium]
METNKQQFRDEGARSVNLGRHQSQCTVCQHPERQEIEEEWINWVFPTGIAERHGISRDALYRHAHACDLFSKRQKNRKLILEKILERVDWAPISGSAFLSTYKVYDKITSAEEEKGHLQGENFKKSLKQMSQEERGAFARDGSLPEWFSKAIGATSGDGQEGEKESQVTETTRVQ